jgi:hypothetical protein
MKEELVMSAAESKTVDVEIAVKETPVGDICTVAPGDVVVAKDYTINFVNLTGADIIIQFSEAGLFSTPLPDKDKITPAAGHWPAVVASGERGFYPYAVYCERTKSFAVGGSMPIIIIKR